MADWKYQIEAGQAWTSLSPNTELQNGERYSVVFTEDDIPGAA